MEYSLSYIKQNRYDSQRSSARKLQERFIPLNVVVKFLSPYTTYVFLNLGVKPDVITFLSIVFVLFGALFFIFGNFILGLVTVFIFTLLDSTDGDMARCVGPSKYGGTLDSFGADFFYALIPVTVGFYIYEYTQESFGLLSDTYILFIGALASLTFLLYRLINAKMIGFLREHGEIAQSFTTKTHFEKQTGGTGLMVKLIKLYRHELIKGNFFSEPGIVFWLIILGVLGEFKILVYYLLVIALYNSGYLLINFIRTYLTFRKV